MKQATKRILAEGAGYGLVAGMIFGVMEVIGAALMGNPALMPVKMFASVVVGKDAMMATRAGILLLGVVAHLALSAVFGVVYAGIDAAIARKKITSYGAQASLGLAYGVALWFVNFHIIARFAYPWFLEAPQFLQAMMHVLFFGLPLGLFIAATERRAARVGAPQPA